MKNNQNTGADFRETLVNAEFGEKLARFKILAEFLANSFIYYYQAAYGGKSFTQEDHDIVRDKYNEFKVIIDDTLGLFEADSKQNKAKN